MDTTTILLLCTVAFAAGFVDAVSGGGGLVQTPMALVLLPHLPVATVIGTLKIPACSGTAFAAWHYAQKVTMNTKLLTVSVILAFTFAFTGSYILTLVHNDYMKPVLLIVLTFVAIYTYTKKNFGQHTHKNHSFKMQMIYTVLISIALGFYDGFIGPGAGSFLVLAHITLLGFDFLHSSAHAKIINLATNFGSVVFFVFKGSIIWSIAVPMAVCNALGGALGARMAVKKGNQFIRIFFLVVIVATLIRFGYDVLWK